MVRRFYRSVHQICGHRIELARPDRAAGAVYCRAEHEVGDEWIVTAICYFDEHARVDGEWFLLPAAGAPLVRGRRDPHPAVGRLRRLGGSSQPKLPAEFASWTRFWDGDGRATTLTTALATNGATR
jgi:hypothetical protein